MRNTPRNFLFDLKSDDPFREATPEELAESRTAHMGTITVGGHEYYVDHYYGEDLEDPDGEDWYEEKRRERAHEAYDDWNMSSLDG